MSDEVFKTFIRQLDEVDARARMVRGALTAPTSRVRLDPICSEPTWLPEA